MASERITEYVSPEQYLAIDQTTGARYEYISGEVIAMAAPSRRHGLIVANVLGELRGALREQPCAVSAGIAVAATAAFLIPDVVVYCGGEFTGDDDILTDPVVIIEVLSPSTSDYDHGHKWMRYQQIQSLLHYVLISQDEPHAEMYTRESDGWRYLTAAGLDAALQLSGINCVLELSGAYDRIVPEYSLDKN